MTLIGLSVVAQWILLRTQHNGIWIPATVRAVQPHARGHWEPEDDSCGAEGPAAPVGDAGGFPASWPWPDGALSVVSIWCMIYQTENPCVCLHTTLSPSLELISWFTSQMDATGRAGLDWNLCPELHGHLPCKRQGPCPELSPAACQGLCQQQDGPQILCGTTVSQLSPRS